VRDEHRLLPERAAVQRHHRLLLHRHHVHQLRQQLVTLRLGLALAVLAIAGCQKNIPLPEVRAVPRDDAALIERGRYLAENVGVCMSCHTPRDFSFFSGLPVRERLGEGADVGMVFGYWPPRISMWAPNLTPTHLASWSDAELQRAFVSGLGRDGHSLMLAMPYDQYNALSADDARAIIAYLRALPPLPGEVPARKLPFPVEPFIVNIMPLEPHLVERTPTLADGSAAYGKYLAQVAGCLWCHSPMTKFDQVVKGKEWAGGHEFPRPTAGAELASLVRGPGLIRTPNISMDARSGIGAWTKDVFIARFRSTNREALEKLKPAAGEMNTVMPWAAYAGMTEEDLGAIWDYLATFPAQDNVVNRFEPATQK
jgi:mono/diheme cytochrome c family protein